MKQLDPGASPQEWFGNELRQLRTAQKMSARVLGRLVQVSDDMILAIEKGKYPSCREDVAKRLDDVFKTGGLFQRAWPMAFGSRDADKKQRDADKTKGESGDVPVQVRSGRILSSDEVPTRPGSEPMYRRSLIQVGGIAAVAPIGLAQEFTRSSPAIPTAIRPSHIAQVSDVATAISGWDNRFGGGGMISGIGSRAMQWSAGLLQAECPAALRPELFAAVSRLGIVVGATEFDAYEHDDAQRTFKFAADCAEEAGDWHLRAKTYSFLARQAVWIGAPDDGLTYAEKGLVRSDRLTATEQAMLHTARARAFGKMGHARETMAAVGQADDAFARAQPTEDPPWMAYYDAAQHSGDTAHALFDLAILANQDPGRAARRFSTAVHGHTDAFKRSRAISRTKLAALLMAKGDPRQAAHIGHDALDEVGRLTSRRAIDDLRQLGSFAAKHPKIQEANALRERIGATVSV
ncbi:helix-turn-helix transcriptional regulator [Streptomyces sp. SRF1]|uniref:helix-turn-helix domain-containing protein n=1 Tax=Streptomyces sp. SRF1 TaxID=1549642 RepID=UPI0025B0BD05|nr:helix-turn-helix transcriptional regulator [Streptomyces sp. SRF1]MDN3061311.1 helix-turn-helix transcriptional regulator [Streptomyces sp. SRF1]